MLNYLLDFFQIFLYLELFLGEFVFKLRYVNLLGEDYLSGKQYMFNLFGVLRVVLFF